MINRITILVFLLAFTAGYQPAIGNEAPAHQNFSSSPELLLLKQQLDQNLDQQRALQSELIELEMLAISIEAKIRTYKAQEELSRVEIEQNAIRQAQSHKLLSYLRWIGIVTMIIVGFIGAFLYRHIKVLQLKKKLAIKLADESISTVRTHNTNYKPANPLIIDTTSGVER